MKRCAGCGDPCVSRFCVDCLNSGEPEKPALEPRTKLPVDPAQRAFVAAGLLAEAVLELGRLWDAAPGYTDVTVLSQLAYTRRLAEHAAGVAQ